MPEIVIQLPNLDAKDRIEIEARVNGQKKTYHYRVEIFAWEECKEPHKEHALCLKDLIENYDHDWRLLQIGQATDKNVQVVFKNRFEN